MAGKEELNFKDLPRPTRSRAPKFPLPLPLPLLTPATQAKALFINRYVV